MKFKEIRVVPRISKSVARIGNVIEKKKVSQGCLVPFSPGLSLFVCALHVVPFVLDSLVYCFTGLHKFIKYSVKYNRKAFLILSSILVF